MDKYSVTSGTALKFDSDASWSPTNIRSDAFAWTASGSGTGEYYLRTSGGANPATVLTGLVEPANVQANGTALTAGTAGSLTASQWDWADNDTLGYSTIYVRLSDDADPDSKTGGFVTFTDSPNANDNVFFRGSASFVGGDYSSIELDDITFVAGYSGTIGDALTPLKLDMADANTFDFSGTGICYISLGSAACSPIVRRTASAAAGAAGLYLVNCSALNDLFIRGGVVQCKATQFDDGYVYSGATLYGDADSVCTADMHNTGGTVVWEGTGVNHYNESGTSTINGTDAWTTIRSDSGTVICNTTGTVTNAQAIGTGVVDFTFSGLARTVTNIKAEGSGRIVYESGVVTVTNPGTGDGIHTFKAGR